MNPDNKNLKVESELYFTLYVNIFLWLVFIVAIIYNLTTTEWFGGWSGLFFFFSPLIFLIYGSRSEKISKRYQHALAKKVATASKITIFLGCVPILLSFVQLLLS